MYPHKIIKEKDIKVCLVFTKKIKRALNYYLCLSNLKYY